MAINRKEMAINRMATATGMGMEMARGMEEMEKENINKLE